MADKGSRAAAKIDARLSQFGALMMSIFVSVTEMRL